MAGSNVINSPANTRNQGSIITLLGSLATLQASSLTDLQQSSVTLMKSSNTLQGSANTLQASNNSLIKDSTTDLITSLIDQAYKAKGNFYSHFDNCRSVWSTVAFGYTSWGQILAISSGANGGASFSWDGGTKVHGSIYAGETLTFDRNKHTGVSFICGSTTDPAIRIITWG